MRPSWQPEAVEVGMLSPRQGAVGGSAQAARGPGPAETAAQGSGLKARAQTFLS